MTKRSCGNSQQPLSDSSLLEKLNSGTRDFLECLVTLRSWLPEGFPTAADASGENTNENRMKPRKPSEESATLAQESRQPQPRDGQLLSRQFLAPEHHRLTLPTDPNHQPKARIWTISLPPCLWIIPPTLKLWQTDRIPEKWRFSLLLSNLNTEIVTPSGINI